MKKRKLDSETDILIEELKKVQVSKLHSILHLFINLHQFLFKINLSETIQSTTAELSRNSDKLIGSKRRRTTPLEPQD